jgi:hypothetical protein
VTSPSDAAPPRRRLRDPAKGTPIVDIDATTTQVTLHAPNLTTNDRPGAETATRRSTKAGAMGGRHTAVACRRMPRLDVDACATRQSEHRSSTSTPRPHK